MAVCRHFRTCVRAAIITALVCTASFVKAQTVFFVNANAAYAQPVSEKFKQTNGIGLGADATGGIGWKKTFFTVTTGYYNFFQASGSHSGSVSFTPVKGGIRQYLVSKILYVHGDAGIGTIKNNGVSDSRLSADVGAGVKLGGFQLQLDYDGYARKDPEPEGYNGWVSIKAGFIIGL